jgi:hypothetical protein
MRDKKGQLDSTSARVQQNLYPVTRGDWVIGGLLFLFWLSTYIRTLAPSLLYGDSGEFQTLSYTLGMTHPTGYPVYLLLGKLFSFLPVGNIAYRINFMSAVFAALALALLYLDTKILTGSQLAALPGAIMMGVFDVYWWQAVIAELYAPATAWIAGILLLLFLWQLKQNPRFLFVAGMLGGLSLGVHNTVALSAPAVLIYLAVTSRQRKSWLMAITGAVLGVLIAVGAFIFIDSLKAPSSYYNSVAYPSLSVWGMDAGDFDSPGERLFFLYAARQFRPFMFSQPISTLPQRAFEYVGFLQRMFTVLGIALTAIGLITLLLKKWREGTLIAAALLTMLGFLLNYHVGDIVVFYLPTLVYIHIAAGYGIAFIMNGADWIIERIHQPPARWEKAAGYIAASLLLLVALLQAGPNLFNAWMQGHLPITDTIDDQYPYPVQNPDMPYILAQLVLEYVEDDAIIFTDWDMLYVYYYVAHIEQGRTGISIHETYPQDGIEEFAESAFSYIADSIKTRSVYFTDPPFEVRQIYQVRRVRSGIPVYEIQE